MRLQLGHTLDGADGETFAGTALDGWGQKACLIVRIDNGRLLALPTTRAHALACLGRTAKVEVDLEGGQYAIVRPSEKRAPTLADVNTALGEKGLLSPLPEPIQYLVPLTAEEADVVRQEERRDAYARATAAATGRRS